MFSGARGFVLKIVPSKTRDRGNSSRFSFSMMNLPAEVDGSNRLADRRESRGISKLTVLIKQQLKGLPGLMSLGKGGNCNLELHLHDRTGLCADKPARLKLGVRFLGLPSHGTL